MPLIALGVKARNRDFRKKLDSSLESGALSVVVSTWHLIETANTKNLAGATELAEFIDSLKPAWLLERRDAQKLEVEEDFCGFLKVQCPAKPRVTTRSAVVAALNGENDAPKFDIPSPAFVKQWIEHPDQLKVLEETYKKGVDTLLRLRELAKLGKLATNSGGALTKYSSRPHCRRRLQQNSSGTGRGARVEERLRPASQD
jgi:hypothetical protein